MAAQSRMAEAIANQQAEGDALTAAIRGAVQISGSDDAEVKERRLHDFAHGKIRVLVSKPSRNASRIPCVTQSLRPRSSACSTSDRVSPSASGTFSFSPDGLLDRPLMPPTFCETARRWCVECPSPAPGGIPRAGHATAIPGRPTAWATRGGTGKSSTSIR